MWSAIPSVLSALGGQRRDIEFKEKEGNLDFHLDHSQEAVWSMVV